MISQSEGKINPTAKIVCQGLESVQKHVRLTEELRNYSLISLTVTLKYVPATDIALNIAFPSSFGAIALKSERIPVGDFDKFLSHLSLWLCANFGVHESPMRSAGATVRVKTSL